MFDAQLKVLIFFIIATTHTESTKWLIDNPGFDDVASWITGYLPCDRQQIVFPQDYNAILPLPKEVEVTGFVLPRDGAILLNQDSTINFGTNNKKRACVVSDNKAFLKKPKPRKWFDPNSWRTTADMSRNTAVPHMERAPCNNETVIVQRNGPLTIDLENVLYLRLGQMSLAGSIISKDYLRNLLSTDIGQILFQNSQGVNIEFFRDDVCGCHKDFQQFVEPICSNIYQHCERPHCLSPVMPYGSCCAMCGAHLQFAVDNCDDGNLQKLTKIISLAISKEGLANEIDFHVSYIDSRILQAVVVDRDKYDEKSVAFVQRLNATTDWKKVFTRSHQVVLQYSGRPYDGSITFGSILLIGFCLLFVGFVAYVIFKPAAFDNRYENMIPSWLLQVRRWRYFFTRSHFVFARFQNTGAGMTGANVENITMSYNTERSAVEECAFDNPMFLETSKRSVRHEDKELPEPSTETQSLESISIGASTDPTQHVEEQELTEIQLKPDSDNSE